MSETCKIETVFKRDEQEGLELELEALLGNKMQWVNKGEFLAGNSSLNAGYLNCCIYVLLSLTCVCEK